jgi:hypothetical protein
MTNLVERDVYNTRDCERKGPHFGNRIKRKYRGRIYSTRTSSIDLPSERELRGRARAVVPHRRLYLR